MPNVVGILVAALCVAGIVRRPKANVRLLVLLAGLAVAAAIGAKLWSATERGGFAWHALDWELTAGYRYPGAMVAVLVALPVLHRIFKPQAGMGQIVDAGVIGVCAGMVVVRLGCLWNGCCHGIETALPWATRYGVDTGAWHNHVRSGLISRNAEWSAYGHPLQLYFLVAVAAIGIFLLWFRGHRQTYDGQLALLFMALNGVSKGALESLRFSYTPSLQIYSFVMAGIGAAGLIYMARRNKQANCTSDLPLPN